MRWLCIPPMLIAMGSMAQQLVLNPSFEDFSTCPTNLNQLYRALNWNSPTTAVFGLSGTPDYFNACNTGPSVGVPVNNNGYQMAHTGDAYALFGCYLPGTPNFREYVQGTLDPPLLQGVCYHLELYLNMTNGSYATTDFGVWFTTMPLSGINNYAPLPYTPQVVYTGAPILDTAAWTLMSGDFIATGGEVAFVIGLFQNDASSTFVNTGSGIPQSAYFVDDVTLIPTDPISQPCSLPTAVEAIANPPLAQAWIDPTSGELVTQYTEGVVVRMDLYDLSGRLVITGVFMGQRRSDLTGLSSGVYVCQLSTSGGAMLTQRVLKL